MKKIKEYALVISIVAILVLCFATGIMMYGMNNVQSPFRTGLVMFFIGLFILMFGVVFGLTGPGKK